MGRRLSLIAILGAGALVSGCALTAAPRSPPQPTGSASAPTAEQPSPPPICDKSHPPALGCRA